jgi:hypothetical protein
VAAIRHPETTGGASLPVVSRGRGQHSSRVGNRKSRGPTSGRRPFNLPLFTQVTQFLAGPPRNHENELPPRLVSHQWSMALVAGPPRRDENKESSSPWSDVGFAWCSQRARTHTSVRQEPHRHPKLLCLRARTSDSLVEEAPPGGSLIFTSANHSPWQGHPETMKMNS